MLATGILTQHNRYNIMCENVSRRSQYTQCKLWSCTPCVFPSHQLISPEAVSTGHSIYNAQ